MNDRKLGRPTNSAEGGCLCSIGFNIDGSFSVTKVDRLSYWKRERRSETKEVKEWKWLKAAIKRFADPGSLTFLFCFVNFTLRLVTIWCSVLQVSASTFTIFLIPFETSAHGDCTWMCQYRMCQSCKSVPWRESRGGTVHSVWSVVQPFFRSCTNEHQQ